MNKRILLFLIAWTILSCRPGSTLENTFRLNHIQVIGSHNSYKQAIQPELLAYSTARDSQVMNLAYEHLPLIDQLELGLRKLEIDIYHDPAGGLYQYPLGNQLLASKGLEILEFDPLNKLTQPGFKVFHVQDVDFRSHCLLLEDCLKTLKSWSLKNERHLPVIITINVKTEPLGDPNAVIPLEFTSEVYRLLDRTITDILEKENIITPDFIKGSYSNLNQAILSEGWPELDACRGKFLLVLDEPMDKINTYLNGHLEAERLMFVNVPPGHPEAAFIISNDPIKNEDNIRNWVADGYIVRTRADADTGEARRMDFDRFEAAKRSGAQYISTDYYYKTKDHPDFIIKFNDQSYVRCNPNFAFSDCKLEL